MTDPRPRDAVDITKEYYDSSDADEFYFAIWGGEDIHIGLYDNGTSIREASRKTVEKMASLVENLGEATRVLDIGAGYGGAARYLAKTYGCFVSCLNISETQNNRNRQMIREQRLENQIEVRPGNFEQLPHPDASFDVVWSQDAILHSGRRTKVLEEVKRVLEPGGQFIFTDPMQKQGAPAEALRPVYDRIHLTSLGSFEFYRQTAAELDFEEVHVVDLSDHLPRHYARIREELQNRYDEVVQISSKAYVDRMIEGLDHWVDAGSQGYLTWGIMHFRKPDRT
jgi:cyclopropane fatty-acyl-phospholipid synthase-like methyltransferase